MHIYLDSANFTEICKAYDTGLIDGVTTNPALLSSTGLSYEASVKRVVELVDNQTVFAEVLSKTADEMIEEAKIISEWGKNMIVKLPMMTEGVCAAVKLKKLGIACTLTLVYNAAQAVVAAKAGAMYVAPFITRAYEVGINGADTIAQISRVYRSAGIKTGILAASLRNPLDVVRTLEAGATDLTLPYNVLMSMMYSPVTDMTLNQFLSMWEKAGKASIQ